MNIFLSQGRETFVSVFVYNCVNMHSALYQIIRFVTMVWALTFHWEEVFPSYYFSVAVLEGKY